MGETKFEFVDFKYFKAVVIIPVALCSKLMYCYLLLDTMIQIKNYFSMAFWDGDITIKTSLDLLLALLKMSNS